VAEIEKLVARPLSLGVATPGVKEKAATGPVPPLFPQAPQVSQLGESCTLLITVAAGVVGVGLGVAPGAGVGVGVEPPVLEAAIEDPAPPPQPIMSVANSVMEASEIDVQRLCTANPPKVRSKARSKVLVSAKDFKGAPPISDYSELLSRL
jgi:hypothetical protein